MSLEDLLLPLDRLFRAQRVGYAIIGAYAVAAWGEVRATRDLDFLCETADVERLVQLLGSYGFCCEHREGDAEDPIRHVLRVRAGSGEDTQEIDILAGIRGAPAGIIERAQLVRLREIEVSVASPEDTIILKLIAGSVQDIEDIRSILRVQGDRLSRTLLRSLCPHRFSDALERILS